MDNKDYLFRCCVTAFVAWLFLIALYLSFVFIRLWLLADYMEDMQPLMDDLMSVMTDYMDVMQGAVRHLKDAMPE